jgi:hypothetical protein
VDATLSKIHGNPYKSAHGSPPSLEHFSFTINVKGSSQHLVANRVKINSSDNVFDFSLKSLKQQTEAYEITLSGNTQDGLQKFTASTKLFYLPDKVTGSVTKIDNLNGGLLFKNNVTKFEFKPILPYGFYTDYGGYLALDPKNVTAYADYGFNVVHPIAALPDTGPAIWDYLDELNLLFQYDMRGYYQNISSLVDQIHSIKDHSALLLYYTADEPDGAQDPLNGTKIAYDAIKSIDQYHPVSLVLNCKNYYFEEYTSGADILMEDAYPVGINSTFSKWGTVCNSTYGDCGCDDCVGSLFDVSDRIDTLAGYQDDLGQEAKPIWAVPQSFSGEGYWARDPTDEETWVMNSLAFNHGAKGIMLWTFPTTATLAAANGKMAKVVTSSPVLDFLVGSQPTKIAVSGWPMLDVSYWAVGGQVMISIANVDQVVSGAVLRIEIPVGVRKITGQPWGNVDWKLEGRSLQVETLDPLATSLVVLAR